MPRAARHTNRQPLSDEERAAIRAEVLSEVRDALDAATDFEDFQTGMQESDISQPLLSREEIAAMTVEEHIKYKSAIDRVMAQSSAAPPPPTTDPPAAPPASGPRQTGMQLPNEGQNGPQPLTIAGLRAMSVEEHLARKSEIDRFLGGEAA
jgi:hypothetical protein